MRRRIVVLALVVLASAQAALAQPPASVFLEELTSPELAIAVAAGTTTILIPVGGTEQIGLVIVLDQVPKLLGIHITKLGFFRDLVGVAQHLPESSLITLAVAAGTFAVLIGMEWLRPHSPAPLVAVGGAIAASWFFGLKTLGSLPSG